MNDEVDLRDLLRTLWRRRWLAIGTTAVSVLASVVISYAMPPTYESSVSILVHPSGATFPEGLLESVKSLQSSGSIFVYSSGPALPLEAYASAAKTPALERRVASKMKTGSVHLAVKVDRPASMLTITASAHTPQEARTLAALAAEECQAFWTQLAAAAGANPRLVVVSPAFEPACPVRPRIGLNVSVGLVLGAMIGAFLVLVAEWWRSTGESTQQPARPH